MDLDQNEVKYNAVRPHEALEYALPKDEYSRTFAQPARHVPSRSAFGVADGVGQTFWRVY